MIHAGKSSNTVSEGLLLLFLSIGIVRNVRIQTHHQFVLELPSCLVHPLTAPIVTKPRSGNLQDISYYPTWKLASTNLHAVLKSLWESLEPETEKIIGNVELLPFMQNHVESHVLHALHDTEDPQVCHLRPIGENPCKFCGQDSRFCNGYTLYLLFSATASAKPVLAP
jgi:hypothetical protein